MITHTEAAVDMALTLALAYAQEHPERVSELVLLATTLTDTTAVEWITETVGRLFPQEWDEFRAAAGAKPGQRLVDAYYELLTDPNPLVREQAASAWMRWEDAHISLAPHPPSPQALIQQVVRFADDPSVRHRIVFLPDYDMSMARYLYWGCDVWLNNPLRPLEACGTSGMKSALNGGLNLSVRDGWWDELPTGTTAGRSPPPTG